MGRKRQLTPRQQDYADSIIGAGLAVREDVEDAFRERSPENEAKIASWGATLTQKRKEAREAALRRIQTQERCAYPGCTKTIEVKRTWSGDPGTPRPTREITLITQMEGWHWKGLGKEDNTKTTTIYLWGCSSEHQKGIFCLEFTLVPTLVEQQEQPQIQYPMGHETQWKVYELARERARTLVAQAPQAADLPHIRRTIKPVAEQEVKVLIAASDPTWLTDNLEQFRALYIEEFVEGYLEGLRAHKRGLL